MFIIYLFLFSNLAFSQLYESYSILDSIVNKLSPPTSKSIITQVNTSPFKKDRLFKYEYFVDNIEGVKLIKYIFPQKVKNNSFLIKNNGKDIWGYFNKSQTTRKLGSHVMKQGIQNSDFTFEDLGKNNNWLTNYKIDLKKEKNDFIIHLHIIDKKKSDYDKIIIYANVETLYPSKIIYIKDNINEKTLFLDDILQKNNFLYAQTMIMKNILTKTETKMIIDEIEFDVFFDNDIFNENRLQK
tara:strand:- start:8803 stop:9525 length:723 start_codon:yes stop_codon:yes gene_type:complete